MFRNTIDKLYSAIGSSAFGCQTNAVFYKGIKFLEELENDPAEMEARIAKHNYIIVGVITLAHLAEAWKYREISYPKQGEELILDLLGQYHINLIATISVNAYRYVSDDDLRDKVIIQIGKYVLDDGVIPLYLSSKFWLHNIDIMQLTISPVLYKVDKVIKETYASVLGFFSSNPLGYTRVPVSNELPHEESKTCSVKQ